MLTKMKKRGVSPVVATVLLISIVVVIALIVFLWFKGIQEEAITKFDGTNIKLICEEVKFDASYNEGTLRIANTGNVPIYKIKAKIFSAGSYETIILENNWPETGLLQLGTYAGELGVSGEKMLLTPVLWGIAESGSEKEYTCEERHAKEILM